MFMQGLVTERIQTIVRANGESALMSICTDAGMEEESAVLLAKERGFLVLRSGRGPEGQR
jgi:hypothetical protein